MSNKVNIFLPVTHAEEKGLADSQYEWSTPQEHPGCDLLVQKNFCHDGSWYLKNDIRRTSKTIAKVTNILRELANTNTTKKDTSVTFWAELKKILSYI